MHQRRTKVAYWVLVAAIGAGGLIGLSSARAQQGTLSPKEIVDKVIEANKKIFQEGRHIVTQTYTARAGAPTLPVVESQGTYRYYMDLAKGVVRAQQSDHKVRTIFGAETPEGVKSLGLASGLSIRPDAGTVDWVRRGDVLQIRATTPGAPSSGAGTVGGANANASERLGTSADPSFADPFATLVMFELMLNGNPQAFYEKYQGQTFHVVRNREPVEMSPGISAVVEFWARSQDFLVTVLRMQVTTRLQQADPDFSMIQSSLDSYYSYQLNAQFADDVFELKR
jgi:hypothetical protein